MDKSKKKEVKKKEEDGSTVTNKDDLYNVPVKKDKMTDEGMGASAFTALRLHKALRNVGLLFEGQSLLYCANNFKMAVCFGQSIDSLHPESAPPSELFRCVPHLSPTPISCKGSLSLPVGSHYCAGTELFPWR